MFYLVTSVFFAIIFVISLIVVALIVNKNKAILLFPLVVVFIFSIWSCLFVFGSISKGKIGVLNHFGKVNMDITLTEGLYSKNPFTSVTEMSIVPEMVSRNTETNNDGSSMNEAKAITSDEVDMGVEVSFAFKLNKTFAPWVYRNFGTVQQLKLSLMLDTASTALRDGFKEFDSNKVVTSNRQKCADKIGKLWSKHLVARLKKVGKLEEGQYSEVFTVLPVMLRKIERPSTIQEAINEKKAAVQLLEKQDTLDSIAERIKTRQTTQGAGINNLLTSFFPKGEVISPEKAAKLIHSLAALQNAKTLHMMGEKQNVKTIYIQGQIPVTVPGN